MPKDLKGIHKYTETDQRATFSELLNMGQDSVSDATMYLVGTSAKRAALDPAPAGAMWQDTDNGQRLWSVSPAGKWRLHAGVASKPGTPWEVTSGGISGRSFTFDIPTVISTNETIMLTHTGGVGFVSFASLDGIDRQADKTRLTIRHVQFLNATVTACKFAWLVVPVGATP